MSYETDFPYEPNAFHLPPEDSTNPQAEQSQATKKCDAFVRHRLQEVADSPLSPEEKEGLKNFIIKQVKPLKAKDVPEVKEGLKKLYKQVEAYKRLKDYLGVKAASIQNSALSAAEKEDKLEALMQGAEAALTCIEEGHAYEAKDISKMLTYISKYTDIEFETPEEVDQTDTVSEIRVDKVSDLISSMLKDLNKPESSLEQENRLLMSRLIREKVEQLRKTTRNRPQVYEEGLKALRTKFDDLAKEVQKIEALEKEIIDVMLLAPFNELDEDVEVNIRNSIDIIKDKGDAPYILSSLKKLKEDLLDRMATKRELNSVVSEIQDTLSEASLSEAAKGHLSSAFKASYAGADLRRVLSSVLQFKADLADHMATWQELEKVESEIQEIISKAPRNDPAHDDLLYDIKIAKANYNPKQALDILRQYKEKLVAKLASAPKAEPQEFGEMDLEQQKAHVRNSINKKLTKLFLIQTALSECLIDSHGKSPEETKKIYQDIENFISLVNAQPDFGAAVSEVTRAIMSASKNSEISPQDKMALMDACKGEIKSALNKAALEPNYVLSGQEFRKTMNLRLQEAKNALKG